MAAESFYCLNELDRNGDKWEFSLYGSDFANAKYLSI